MKPEAEIVPSEDESAFFVLRKGNVFACYLGGKPAHKLGPLEEVGPAMLEFIASIEKSDLKPPPKQDVPSTGPECNLSEDSIGPLAIEQYTTTSTRSYGSNDRKEDRIDVAVLGIVRTSRGKFDVTIQDLSLHGCMFAHPLRGIALGDMVTVRIGTVGPIGAEVRWKSERQTGVMFDAALYPSVLDHIRDQLDIRK